MRKIEILMKEYHAYYAEIPDDFDFDSVVNPYDILKNVTFMSDIGDTVGDGEIAEVCDFDTGDMLYE